MKMILSKLSNTLNKHLIFPRKARKYLTAIAATIFISCFLIQPASAGRPPGKQRIYLGNFNAPALIPLTGVLIPGSTAVGSVGDQVTIDAELFTSDPNEDGEGEPLVLISLPSLNSGISHYYEQKRFTFNIAKAGQTLAANINGYDGDETATLSGWIDPAPPKPTFTDDEKAQFAAAGERLELLAASEDAAAKTCVRLRVVPPNICEIFETASVANSLLAEVDKNLALDPPDPNFTVIDQPIIPSLPLLTLGPGLTQAEVDSFNALLINQEKIIGISRATLTAINRSVGAYDANNDLWEMKQREAAAQYSLQLSSLTHEQATLLANWQTAWRNGSIGAMTVTSSDVLNAEIELINFGLPPTYVQKLQQLGVDNVTIETIKNRLRVQDIYAASGIFPDMLTNPSLITALNKAADSFYEAALNNATPLTRDQQVEGEGFIRNLSGDATFEFEARVNDSGNLAGALELRVQSSSFNFRITQGSVTHAALLGKIAILDGTYSASDATTGTFQIIATDAGREGENKGMVTISLSNGYRVSGALDRGSIQIKTHQSDD